MSIWVDRSYVWLDSALEQVTRGVRRLMELAGVENSLIAWLAGEEKRDSFCVFLYMLWGDKKNDLK